MRTIAGLIIQVVVVIFMFTTICNGASSTEINATSASDPASGTTKTKQNVVIETTNSISNNQVDYTKLKQDISYINDSLAKLWNIVTAFVAGILATLLATIAVIRKVGKQYVKSLRREMENTSRKESSILAAAAEEHKNSLNKHIDELSDYIKSTVSVQYIYLSSQSLLSNNKIDEALDGFNRALEIDPTNKDCIYGRALCYRKKGHPFKSLALSDMLSAYKFDEFKSNPDFLLSLAETYSFNGDYENGRKFCFESIQLGVSNKATALTIIGDCYRRQARETDVSLLRSSIDSYNDCLNNWRWHTPAIEGKFYALMALGEIDEAIAVCSTPLQEGQEASNYYRLRAFAKWRRDIGTDKVDAWDDLNRSKDISPRDTNNYSQEATFHISEGEIDKAIKSLEMGIKYAHPSYKPTFRNRLAGILLAANQPKEALEQGQSSVKDNPRYVQNWITLSVCLLANKLFVDAVKAAENGVRTSIHQPGKIWCKLICAIATSCQGASCEIVAAQIKELELDLDDFPHFQPSYGWYCNVIIKTIRLNSIVMNSTNLEALTKLTERIFTSDQQEMAFD